MRITLENAGKRFNRDWIFRSVNYTFEAGKSYAVTGNNGSGKSTLLQCICGAMELNEGKNAWISDKAHPIRPENIYHYFSLAAPYLDLIEEMTTTEFLRFHASFKPFVPELSVEEIVQIVQLSDAANKQIRNFSSGMKQRIRLAQAIFSRAPVLLLDEPCSNLDKEGYLLYQKLIAEYCRHKLIIISSNEEAEYAFCEEKIDIRAYKILTK